MRPAPEWTGDDDGERFQSAGNELLLDRRRRVAAQHPDGGKALPLVDEHRRLHPDESGGVGGQGAPWSGSSSAMTDTARRRADLVLPTPLRSVETDSRKIGHQGVELGINDPANVVDRVPALPLAGYLGYL